MSWETSETELGPGFVEDPAGGVAVVFIDMTHYLRRSRLTRR